jgi:hypothetical protein
VALHERVVEPEVFTDEGASQVNPALGDVARVIVPTNPFSAVIVIGSVQGVEGAQFIVTGDVGLIVKSGCGIWTVMVVF